MTMKGNTFPQAVLPLRVAIHTATRLLAPSGRRGHASTTFNGNTAFPLVIPENSRPMAIVLVARATREFIRDPVFCFAISMALFNVRICEKTRPFSQTDR
jgi:hypothetical protein